MAFSYIVLYSTKIDTGLIYSYRSILGRILWDGLLIPRHLAMLILFRIFKTSFVGIGYILLKTVTQLLAIFRPLLLVQKNQYGRKLRLYVNYGNLKITHILRKATLIYTKTPRMLIPHLELLSHLEVLSHLELLRLYLLCFSQLVSLYHKKL